MSLSDQQILELDELCNALADGAASPEQRARLSRWLRSSADARRHYVLCMALSASLFEYAGEMMTEAPDARYIPFRRIVRIAAWAAVPLAAAAILIFVFWPGAARNARPAGAGFQESDGDDDTVAHLSGAQDCRWTGAAMQVGDEFRTGQKLDLTRGVAEITFDSGAQLVVEAPASIDVASAWNAVLHQGTVKANVPSQAIGFRVADADVDVVDLGTEFSMVAEASGGTEVFVLKGAVEANSPEGMPVNRQRLVLREKQARRFARSGVSDVRDREAKLARLGRKQAFNRSAEPYGYAHWSFDESGVAAFRAQTVGLSSGPYELRAESGGSLETASIAGRWGRALHLDGGLGLQTPFPRLSQRTPRTIAFWTRIAPDTELSDSGPMVGWAVAGRDVRPFEIGWNRNPGRGAFGALQTRFGKRGLVATTPLRDGRWRHVAVVLEPSWKNENAFQIKQYVDGRLEGVTARFGARRKGMSAAAGLSDLAEGILAVGGAGASGELFRGDLDELYLCDRALSPREIDQLVKRNSAVAPELIAAD